MSTMDYAAPAYTGAVELRAWTPAELLQLALGWHHEVKVVGRLDLPDWETYRHQRAVDELLAAGHVFDTRE